MVRARVTPRGWTPWTQVSMRFVAQNADCGSAPPPALGVTFRSVKLVPRDRLVLESDIAPADILTAAIPRAVRKSTTGGPCSSASGLAWMRTTVRVGWWPPLALVGASVTFDGRVSRHDARVVVAGEVGLFPRWYGPVLGGLLALR